MDFSPTSPSREVPAALLQTEEIAESIMSVHISQPHVDQAERQLEVDDQPETDDESYQCEDCKKSYCLVDLSAHCANPCVPGSEERQRSGDAACDAEASRDESDLYQGAQAPTSGRKDVNGRTVSD